MSHPFWSKKFFIIELIGLILFALLIGLLILVVQQPLSSSPPFTSSFRPPARSVRDDGLGELLQVQIISRHGDRTPIRLVRGDPYVNHTWKEGFGQLTNQGKQRVFRFGQVLRQRYAKLLEKTTASTLLAQSSPIRRCLESSESLLAGLLPPRSSQIWSESNSLAFQWQPVAIHTTEPFRSWLLNPTAPCARASQIEAIVTDLPEVKIFLEENQPFLTQLSAAIGYNFTDWRYAFLVYDTLLAERYYFGAHFREPAWFGQLGNDTWLRLNSLAQTFFGLFSESRGYLRLRAGLLLNEIVSHLKNLNPQSPPAEKSEERQQQQQQLLTYTTHDLMISYALQALGLYREMPTFGSGFIVELRANPQNATLPPNIRILYANVTSNYDIYELPLNESIVLDQYCPGSSNYCPVDSFSNALQDFLVLDAEKECQLLQEGAAAEVATEIIY